MNYADGQQVKVGDRLRFDDDEGVVVCSIDTDEYSEAFPKKDWGYLGRGVMACFPKSGLIYFEETDLDLHLVARDSSAV